MTNQMKLNHFDNSKIFYFGESLNKWGASVIVGTIVESRFTIVNTKIILKKHILKDAIKNLDEDHDWT
jgi:hypothetical protein